MTRAGSRVRKRAWRKVVVFSAAGVVALGSLIYWQRYNLTVWFLEGNDKVQEMVILQMLDNARPVIERELKMTLPEKLFSTMTGRRSEKERQTDALKDVRKFTELCFKNHRLKFINVRNLGSMRGFKLHGFDFVLGWNRGKSDEVLAAFNINYLKRKFGKMRTNNYCGFFTELRAYVDKKAEIN